MPRSILASSCLRLRWLCSVERSRLHSSCASGHSLQSEHWRNDRSHACCLYVVARDAFTISGKRFPSLAWQACGFIYQRRAKPFDRDMAKKYVEDDTYFDPLSQATMCFHSSTLTVTSKRFSSATQAYINLRTPPTATQVQVLPNTLKHPPRHFWPLSVSSTTHDQN